MRPDRLDFPLIVDDVTSSTLARIQVRNRDWRPISTTFDDRFEAQRILVKKT